MRIPIRRQILRAGVIRACALINAPWSPRKVRAEKAYLRLIKRLAAS